MTEELSIALQNKLLEANIEGKILKNYQNNGAGWDFGERDAALESE